MTKKAEDSQNALGFVFSLPSTSTSLTTYSGALNPDNALTTTEERLILEASKRQLIIDLTNGIIASGNHAATEMINNAGTEFVNMQMNLNAISETARDTPFHLTVEAFCHQLTRLGVDGQYNITKAGITQILTIMNTPFAMKDVPEEKRSLILRLLGA